MNQRASTARDLASFGGAESGREGGKPARGLIGLTSRFISQGACLRLATLLVLCAAARTADAAEQGDSLPAAARIIERYAKVTGLDTVLARETSIRTTAAMTVVGSTVAGTTTALKVKPNKMVQITTIGGIGETRAGFDGTYAWISDPLRGPRILADLELEDMKVDALFTLVLRDTGTFASRTTIGIAKVGDEPCYRVRVVTRTDREIVDCYSVASGYLLTSERKVRTAAGLVESTTRHLDYHDYSGVKLASRVEQTQGSRTRVLQLQQVKLSDATPSEVELPPAVRALIKP